MAMSTKHALADALKQMMKVKPIAKITVKELVNICNVNRQTFYYHFNDVYDLLEWVFEEDANRALPSEVVYEHWQKDVLAFFQYLYDNADFALNVYHSDSRMYMLRYLKLRLERCIRSFADIVSEGMDIGKQEYEFVIEFYSRGIIGLISQWMDEDMQLPKVITLSRFVRVLNGSMENMLERFQSKSDTKTC